MDWVLDRIASCGARPAFVSDSRSVSYSELVSSVQAWAAELVRYGVDCGSVVAMVGDYSLETTSLMIALLLNRNIVVPLTADTRQQHAEFFRISGAEVVFEMSGPHGEPTISRLPHGTHHEYVNRLRSGQEAGLILFTSGTSGVSKGAVLSVDRLFRKFRAAPYRPEKALRSLVFLKLDHIGGINTLFSVLLNGGTAISVAERSPAAVCRAIERHHVELLPTTPTFLNMLLLSEIYKRHDLSSLKMITYGTEPMPTSTLLAVNKALPGIKYKQTYGLTELGIFSTRSKDSCSGWMTIGGEGVETKVVDNVLYIRCESAMLGYLNAQSPFTDDGWYITGDRVECDGDHYRILGRESEIINVGGEKVFPAEVESTLLELENVRDVLVRGTPSPVTGQIVTALFVLDKPEDRRGLQKRVYEYCLEKLEPFKIPKLVKIAAGEFAGPRLKKMRTLHLGDR